MLIKWRKEKKEEKIGKEIGKPKCHFPFSGFAKHAHRGHFAFAVFLSHRKQQSEGGQLTVERLLLDGNKGMCYNELYRGELQTPKVTYFSRKEATIRYELYDP